MTRRTFGLAAGAALGALDGLTALLSPQDRPLLVSMVLGATLRGAVVGFLAGAVATRVRSLASGIAVGAVAGALLAWVGSVVTLEASRRAVFETLVPGAAVGGIVGYAAQLYRKPESRSDPPR